MSTCLWVNGLGIRSSWVLPAWVKLDWPKFMSPKTFTVVMSPSCLILKVMLIYSSVCTLNANVLGVKKSFMFFTWATQIYLRVITLLAGLDVSPKWLAVSLGNSLVRVTQQPSVSLLGGL